MVKVEAVQKDGFITLYFETRDSSEEGLAELDTVYEALLCNRPKQGGYLGSTKFNVDIKDE